MRDRFPTLTLTTLTALLLAATPALADLTIGGPYKGQSNPVAHTVQEGLGSDPKPDPTGSLGDLAEPRDYGDTDWVGVTFDMPMPAIRFGDVQALQGATPIVLDSGDVASSTGRHDGGGGSTIPAPGAIALLGLATLFGHRRRRQR